MITADLQSESGRKNCFRIARQLAREGRDVISMCCMKNDVEKATRHTGVVSEMMKTSGGFGSRWITDLNNNIVKEGCILDDWRKSTLVPVYKGKSDPRVRGSYRELLS